MVYQNMDIALHCMDTALPAPAAPAAPPADSTLPAGSASYADIAQDKCALRRRIKRITADFCLDTASVASASMQAAALLVRSLLWQNASCVLLYMNTPHEVDTLPLIEMAASQGKRIALPKVQGRGEMDFFYIDAALPLLPQLHTGAFGIKEPAATELVASLSSTTLIVAPGVAFTRDGWRLGHGAGYYDRYIARMGRGGKVAGLCFPCQIVDTIAHDEHDAKMDSVFCASTFPAGI